MCARAFAQKRTKFFRTKGWPAVRLENAGKTGLQEDVAQGTNQG
jgi:hypothetical protein